MKKIAFAIAASLLVSSFAVSTAEAMNLGSLSRERPVIASVELTTSSIPHACGTCGVGRQQSAAVAPSLHIIFISIGGFVRSHLDYAIASSQAARVQLLSMASAD
jgi:hypothetical protein